VAVLILHAPSAVGSQVGVPLHDASIVAVLILQAQTGVNTVVRIIVCGFRVCRAGNNCGRENSRADFCQLHSMGARYVCGLRLDCARIKELKGIGANGFEVESEFDFSGSSESLLLSTR